MPAPCLSNVAAAISGSHAPNKTPQFLSVAALLLGTQRREKVAVQTENGVLIHEVPEPRSLNPFVC